MAKCFNRAPDLKSGGPEFKSRSEFVSGIPWVM